ncbi:transglycosylase SLT domain-containing protein [Actinospongicola halichondriae]|uniref:transglycosylase SLT domain-containing protein n=1 Tax=Actinospongicola halichondriae TaxID=3236844 RepID=UPI003D5B9355
MRTRRIATALLVAVLLVAACAADEGTSTTERAADPTTTSSTSTTTTTAPTTTTITVPAAPRAVEPAADPVELAAGIVEAERITRDPASPLPDVQAAAFELQQFYRQLGRAPDWDAAVLEAVPDDLRTTVRANTTARRQFRSMHRTLSDTLPPWRIVDPPPAEELLSYYREAEAEFGVPWEVLAAVNLVETGMGRIRGTSVAGAQGPMQFMPATWEAFGAGGDINDPHDAIFGAARYLAHNGGGRGDIDTALWNYNHSDRYVEGVKQYAAVMAEDPAAFNGFYHWQVVYLSTSGDVWLPSGFEQLERIPVTDYVAANPDHHLGTDTA